MRKRHPKHRGKSVLLDIIIVNYNSTDHLLECLKSLFENRRDIPVNIMVYDNASKEDDVDRLKRAFPPIRLTKNDRNLGFAKAVNQGLREGSAPYILILNPDTLVRSQFITSAIKYMSAHPEIGILGPKILDHDGTVQGSARAFPNLLTAIFGRKSILSKIFPKNPITRENILTERSDGVTPMEVDWVSGACMLVRRDAVNRVGPLDDKFFMYWEDADWCRRMWQNGWKVIYFPRTSVMHYVGVSSETNIFRSVFEFHKSIYHLYEKHANRPYSFLKPIVFWGIIYRFLFVFSSQLSRSYLQRPQKRTSLKRVSEYWKVNDTRIRVLRFIARLNIGGPSIHVHLLTTELNEQKFHSTLITGKISPSEGNMGYLFESSSNKPIIIEELQREISPLMDLKAFLRIFRLMRRENPDIVHTHTAKAGTSARLAAIIYNRFSNGCTKTVHTFHGHVFSGYFSRTKSLMFIWIERLMARKTDVIVAISQTQKTDLAHQFHIAPAEKISVIPLGFDLAPFLTSHQKKGIFRKSIGEGDATLLVGIVGRLVPIKNHILFLDMAEIFLKENGDLKVKFVVIGDGELAQPLKTHVENRRLNNHVKFCGWRRDLPEVYADLEILALTSKNEGTPVSIIEAMAAGTSVISTDAGGVRDLLGSPEKNMPSAEGFTVCKRGILCRKNDATGFAHGLNHLMRMDIPQRSHMSDEARDFVVRTYSNERLLHDMEKLYLEIVKPSFAKTY
jgi:GT2 family glycosyltransferase/glycosyltransferase involved in cell wall biosynthesis